MTEFSILELAMDLTCFEETVLKAMESKDYLPAYEKFVNSRFFIGVHRSDAGPGTLDFRFDVISNEGNVESYVIIAEDICRLKNTRTTDAIQITGVELAQMLNPEVGIMVALESGGAFGIPKELIQWLRESIQP